MNGDFANIASIKSSRGLFSRIMRRLGLEKQLKTVKNHLWFFGSIVAVFLFLSVFAFIGLKQILAQSGFGPYLALIFSDPGIVLKYWHSFIFSVFESMPGIAIFVFLSVAALTLLFIRFTSIYFVKLLLLVKLIQKSHGKNF